MSWDKKKDVFALMVGHGKSLDGSWDPGCVYNKYTEAALMLPIVKEAVKVLREAGIKVLTDADKNNNRNMKSCVWWANKQGAKLYMSVHCDYKAARSGIAPLYVSAAGKKMAVSVGKGISKRIGLRYRGAFKKTNLFELNATMMPAVILETGAIKADLAKLKSSKAYGKALGEAILEYIGVKTVKKN